MSNYLATSVLGAATPFVDKKKGSLGNRTDCAIKQKGNKIKSDIQTIAALGVGAVATKTASKLTKGKAFAWNTTFNDAFSRAASKLNREIFTCGKSTGVKGLLQKGVIKFAKMVSEVYELASKTSGRTKIVGALALATVVTVGHIGRKAAYKAGQIDQKYTDRAQTQKILKA